MDKSATARRPLRELIAFFAWTLGLTYLVFWGPLAIFRIPGAAAGQQGGAGIGLLPFILGGFVPSIVGIALTAKTEGRASLRQLWRRAVAFRFHVRWYLLALAITLAIGGSRLIVQWLLGSEIRPAEPLATMLVSPVLWIAFTIQIVVMGPLSEEFGWRGYAQDRLMAMFKPLTSSLLLGLLWAVWHIPLFFIPGTSQSKAGQPLLQFAIFAIFVISLAVIMTWLYNRTGRSVGAALLMHTLIGFGGTIVALLIQPSLLDAALQAASTLAVAVLVVLFAGRDLGLAAVTGKSTTAA